MSDFNFKETAMKIMESGTNNEDDNEKILYMVVVNYNIDNPRDVGVVGIFDTIDKADKVMLKVNRWMKEEGHNNYKIYTTPIEINYVYGAPYGIQKYIFLKKGE